MSKLILYKCETPVHVGSGTELGVVDMPIQREIHTGFPKVEASGIKGVFRNDFNKSDESNNKITDLLFGPENDGSDYASSLEFTDARILFFPVKSAKGIFAWVTCPFVINRFINELNIMEIHGITINMNNVKPSEDTAVILNKSESNIILNDNKSDKEKYISLEEFGYKVSYHENIFGSLIGKMKSIDKEDENYIIKKLNKDIVVVNDEAFSYFVNMSTEVDTRIRIAENGVVKDGALFTEEYVPEEAVMYNFINLNEELLGKIIKNSKNSNKMSFEFVKKRFMEEYLGKLKYVQLGGNKTLGKGIARIYSIR